MRSLLILLPVFWLGVFWGVECCHVRPGLIFLAAAAYALCGFSQILFNTFEITGAPAEGNQLEGDFLP